MESIYIPQLLQLPEKKAGLTIEQFISGWETLTPVRGKMVIAHCGNYLEIMLKAETIVTLVCDRCLQNYNHRLAIETSEIVWLEETEPLEYNSRSEREVHLEDLSEKLPPRGYFEPEKWLYEQLSLAMPLRQLCDQNCPGTEVVSSDPIPLIDSRWASLVALRDNFSH